MNDSIAMVRNDLQHIPDYVLPPGYSYRWYQKGDEELWVKIHLLADQHNRITPELFQTQFGSDEQRLRMRQCYIFDPDGTAIGTATAWYDDDYQGMAYGRVHWVAITPPAQGQGLAKPLMTLICERLKWLRHERAYLTTSAVRIPAVNLYLHFGFAPVISSEEEFAKWERIRGQLKYPVPLPVSSFR